MNSNDWPHRIWPIAFRYKLPLRKSIQHSRPRYNSTVMTACLGKLRPDRYQIGSNLLSGCVDKVKTRKRLTNFLNQGLIEPEGERYSNPHYADCPSRSRCVRITLMLRTRLLRSRPVNIKMRFIIFCCFFLIGNACQQQRAEPQGNSPKLSSSVSPTPTVTSDPCELLKNDEIQSVQGPALKTKHPSSVTQQGYRTLQCLYQTEDINRSVSVSVTEADPDDPQRYSVKALWKKMFAKKSKTEKEREERDSERQRSPLADKEEEEEESAAPPKRVNGLGDDAYWVAAKYGGVLYVLKNERFIRISVGGRDDLTTKLRSSTTLARMALSRLS
jgi:hypothetical protein